MHAYTYIYASPEHTCESGARSASHAWAGLHKGPQMTCSVSGTCMHDTLLGHTRKTIQDATSPGTAPCLAGGETETQCQWHTVVLNQSPVQQKRMMLMCFALAGDMDSTYESLVLTLQQE